MSQGQNVIKGDRLVVDMTSGVSRVECQKGSPSCRVQALFVPGAMKQQPSESGSKDGKDAPKSILPGLPKVN